MEVVGIALHFAGQDANKALPAHKGINGGLKDLRGECIFRTAFLDFPADGVCTNGHLEIRRGHIFHKPIHQLTDTDILLCRSTEYRENLAGLNALNHGSCHFYFGDFLTFDVFFQQFIVEFCHCFNEFLTGGFHIAFDVFRHLVLHHFIVVGHNLHMQGQQVNYALESCFLADRNLHRHNTIAKANPQFLYYTVKVSMFPVHLVDEECSGQFIFLGKSKCAFGSGFNA